MIPDIIKFFNGGDIPIFQNSGKLGWDNPSAHSIPAYSERAGVYQQDWGEIQTDENGLQYRDVRYNRWQPGSSSQNYSTTIERVYNPNQKGYKKANKKGLIPYMTSSEKTDWGVVGNRDNYGYTAEQADSLHNRFNDQFGPTSDGIGELAGDNWEEIYDKYYKYNRY